MPITLDTNRDNWSEIDESSLTRVLYGKQFRVQTPEGGERFVESEAELQRVLEQYYGDD